MGGLSKNIAECTYEGKGFFKYCNFKTLRGKTRAHIIIGFMMLGAGSFFKYKVQTGQRRLKAEQAAQAVEDRRVLEIAKEKWLANGRRFLE